jgi:hypothetical protein
LTGLRSILLAIRFLFELGLLASFAYWGFALDVEPPLRWLAGIGAPLLAAVIWGLWIAPKATRQLSDPIRFVAETVLFLAGGLALFTSGQPALAATFFVVFLVDRMALTATGGTGT